MWPNKSAHVSNTTLQRLSCWYLQSSCVRVSKPSNIKHKAALACTNVTNDLPENRSQNILDLDCIIWQTNIYESKIQKPMIKDDTQTHWASNGFKHILHYFVYLSCGSNAFKIINEQVYISFYLVFHLWEFLQFNVVTTEAL